MRDEYVEAVLEVVELIPSGRVLTYGDIAEILGEGGPRQVGAVMSRHGGSVPWWRVVRAGGVPPACHEGQACAYYEAEGTPLRRAAAHDGGCRLELRTARWVPGPEERDELDQLLRRHAGATRRDLSEPSDLMEE